MRLINYYSKQVVNLLGQLLVVARHTDSSPSSCYEPELIPDPLRWHINKCLCNKRKGGMDLGSDGDRCGYKPL
jgi:hypothetical protein